MSREQIAKKLEEEARHGRQTLARLTNRLTRNTVAPKRGCGQKNLANCGRASPSFTGGWPKPILLSVTGLWLLIADHVSGGCSDHSGQHPSKGDRCRNSCRFCSILGFASESSDPEGLRSHSP